MDKILITSLLPPPRLVDSDFDSLIRSLELPLNLVPNYDLKIEDFDTWAETW